MKRPVLFACDFETTGLDARRDYPHQLAITVLTPTKHGRDYEVSDRDSWRIRVPRSVRFFRRRAYYGAMAVHRIPPGVLHNVGEDVRTVAKEVSQMAAAHAITGGKVMLAAQNLAFDAGFMRRLFDLGGFRYPFGYHGVDLTGLAVMLLGTHRFKDTVKALGVKERTAHDAQGDADMLADCLIALARHGRFERHTLANTGAKP